MNIQLRDYHRYCNQIYYVYYVTTLVETHIRVRVASDQVSVTRTKFYSNYKVTFRPNFTGKFPNVKGLSPENYEVLRDAKLSRILNPVPILSQFE